MNDNQEEKEYICFSTFSASLQLLTQTNNHRQGGDVNIWRTNTSHPSILTSILTVIQPASQPASQSSNTSFHQFTFEQHQFVKREKRIERNRWQNYNYYISFVTYSPATLLSPLMTADSLPIIPLGLLAFFSPLDQFTNDVCNDVDVKIEFPNRIILFPKVSRSLSCAPSNVLSTTDTTYTSLEAKETVLAKRDE